jgi:Na+/melibiose symporter-like transporter
VIRSKHKLLTGPEIDSEVEGILMDERAERKAKLNKAILNQTNQDTKILLRPWMVALVWLCFGVIYYTAFLTDGLDTQELWSLSFIVFCVAFAIVICVVIIAAMNPTPKWSTNAKRLNLIGAIVLFCAYPIAETLQNPLYGFVVCAMAIIILLSSTLYPGAILFPTHLEQPEREIVEE